MSDKAAYYGANPFKLFFQNWRDRRAGKQHRINARKGFLSPPQERGKVIWIRAGRSEQSVLIASEIMAAIRHKRQDVRLVLTYEEEYPDILAPRFKGLQKIGFGYGPSDSKRAVKRVLKRFQPLAVILVDEPGGGNLMQALSADKGIRKVALQWTGEYHGNCEFDACLPLTDSALMSCKQTFPAQDVMSMLVNAQVEPSFGGIVKTDVDLPLWCVLGVQKTAVHNLLQFTTQHEGQFATAYLCLSFSSSSAEQLAISGLQQQGRNIVRLSEWQRESIEPGSVLILDEPKWIAAVSASASAIHLLQADRYTFWQVMASGRPVSVAREITLPESSVFAAKLPKYDLVNEVPLYWNELQATPFQARQAGDQLRSVFWQLRRNASKNIDDFLERVFNW